MQSQETPRLLFVHAHPDDETLTTGGTIAHYVARGADVRVVTCTLGEEGEMSKWLEAILKGQAAGTDVGWATVRVADNRVDITRDDGATSSLWWATRNEWLGLVDIAGLEVEALYGGFAHEPFTDDSREYVFVARRQRAGG